MRERNAIRLIESMSAPYAAMASMRGAKLATALVMAPALRMAGRRTRTFQGTRAVYAVLILLMSCSVGGGLVGLFVPRSDVIILMRSARQW